MSSFEQVEEILTHTEEFHNKASILFSELLEKCDSEKAKNLALYLSEHESKIASEIGRFRTQSTAKALKGFFKYTFATSFEQILHEQKLGTVITTEDLLATENAFDNYFGKLYEDLALHSIDEVKELCESLFSKITQEKKQLSKTTNFLYEY